MEPRISPAVAKKISTPFDAWKLFITDRIIQRVVECANIKLDEIRPNYERSRDVKPTDATEIEALIGLLYLAGLHNSSHVNWADLFTTDGTGIEYFRLIMTEKRLRLLLLALRFDNIDTNNREIRLQSDKLAKFREIFEEFVINCQNAYIRSEKVIVDEMVEAFRGHCGFRQYIPNKPAKYGIKIFALTDAKTYYSYNLEIYCGTQPEGPR